MGKSFDVLSASSKGWENKYRINFVFVYNDVFDLDVRDTMTRSSQGPGYFG